jgi:hypothetical protein
LPAELARLVQFAIDFNSIMQGAVIRYNLLVQRNRNDGDVETFESHWEGYLQSMHSLNWTSSDEEFLSSFSAGSQSAKRFVLNWINIIKSAPVDLEICDKLIREREISLKGLKRSRLFDKSVAQKQSNPVGIQIGDDGVSYLTYRWQTVRTFLNDVENALT